MRIRGTIMGLPLQAQHCMCGYCVTTFWLLRNQERTTPPPFTNQEWITSWRLNGVGPKAGADVTPVANSQVLNELDLGPKVPSWSAKSNTMMVCPLTSHAALIYLGGQTAMRHNSTVTNFISSAFGLPGAARKGSAHLWTNNNAQTKADAWQA